MNEYNPNEIDPKWQKYWEENNFYQAEDGSKKPKFYCLIEFPYPSGDGLHVGHPRSYTALDILARKRRMEGFNVLYPICWDAFGMPTANFAIKTGVHPREATEKNVANFKRQLKSLGLSFDWSREINTTDPAYYKWTQWIFLQFFKKGLAYKTRIPINWCLSCKIGLANEEVVDGKCERCGGEVEKREKEQWMLEITKYADRLLEDLNDVDYLPKIKTQQENWIGRSEGAIVEFETDQPSGGVTPFIKVFTTRPDTLFGATYMVLAPEHELVDQITTDDQIKAVEDYKKKAAKKSDLERGELEKEKTGVFTGAHAINPVFVNQSSDKEISGVGIILESKEKKIILQKRDNNTDRDPNMVAPFGGGIKKGETVVAAAQREIFEETGIKFSKDRFRSFGDFTSLNTPGQKIRMFYVSGVDVKSISLSEGEGVVEMNRENVLDSPETTEFTKLVTDHLSKAFIPIWIADYVLTGYGTGAIMAVPAHDERDFEFATKYELPIKQVVAPCVVDESNPPQKGKKTVTRKMVFAIIRDPKTGKYLCLDWKEHPWTTFVLGGVEDGEDLVEAAKREIEEETGYVDLEFRKFVSQEVRSEYYAAHKEENRVAYSTAIMFDLKSEKQVSVSDEEKAKHEPRWVDRCEITTEKMACSELSHWEVELENESGQAYVGDGELINSDFLNGLETPEAIKKMNQWLEKNKHGKAAVNYKLRDWVFSRQRYWGEPIPLVHCTNCTKTKIADLDNEGSKRNTGWVPLPDDQLPLELPEIERYEPTDTGESPLAAITDWVETECPVCGGPAKRETDTMPNWAGSSWYFLRYCDPHNDKEFASMKKLEYWMAPAQRSSKSEGGVDWYNGGMEHTTLHLLYSRFWNKFLFDEGLVPTSEPYQRRTSHGLILAEDGNKMSKSRGNVVNPDEVVEKYGADTLRCYEMFIGPFAEPAPWSTNGIQGVRRFLEKVWRLQDNIDTGDNEDRQRLLHKTIKKVTEDVEAMHFNTAISAMMIFINECGKSGITKDEYKTFLAMLSTFAPHTAEEIWESMGGAPSVTNQPWPEYDEKLVVDEKIELPVQVNGKLRATLEVAPDASEQNVVTMAHEDDKLQKWLEGKDIKKVIYVPGRLINFVI